MRIRPLALICLASLSATFRALAAQAPESPAPRAIALEHVTGSELLPILEQLLADGAAGGEPGVRIAVDPRVNALLVDGPPAAVATVAALVARLDVPADDVEVGRDFRLVPLRHAQAAELAIAVADRLRDERNGAMASAGGAAAFVRVRRVPVVVPHPDGSALFVSAGRFDFERIEQLVAELDVPPVRAPEPPARCCAPVRSALPRVTVRVVTVRLVVARQSGAVRGCTSARRPRGSGWHFGGRRGMVLHSAPPRR
ncbi:MAG: hypothetical protein IPM29_23890 [Planctomycetes bacterium]|nr:hypothetical protein [Planctomycetota bacterium]